MLTGNLVRVRHARDRIVPSYLDLSRGNWRELAEELIAVFRGQDGSTRGEIEADIEEAFGNDPGQLVGQGLIKLLEDRCEFEVDSGVPPDQVREVVFRSATRARAESPTFDRAAVLASAAGELGVTPEAVEQGLFADLRSEQRLVRFKDLSPEHLLERYNVALAQAVLLRSTRVHVTVRNETPQRLRQIVRRIKFHRLICELEKVGPDGYRFHLDGPLSLFSATQKYGLQLAIFLPAVLPCKDFELKAELRWGAQRKPKTFLLTSENGLSWPWSDGGGWVPTELKMFADLFAKRHPEWEITEEADVISLGTGFWVPDFRLRHRATKKSVLLEVLGFWRKASAEKHLARLRQHATQPFLLAVSDALHIDEGELAGLPAGIHRFRQMPLPDEVVRLACGLLGIEEKRNADEKPRKTRTTRKKEKPEEGDKGKLFE